MGTPKHNYKCQVCGKVATKNFVNKWLLYEVTETGEFEWLEDIDGDKCEYLCDKCYDKQESGK